jgi:hypothetical protein
MEDKDELDETLIEIAELLESIRLRVPEIEHTFSDLETKSEKESDVEYKL